MAKSPNWGGAGRGQGRKKQVPEGAIRRTILLTDEEHVKVRELIDKLRDEKEKDKNG